MKRVGVVLALGVLMGGVAHAQQTQQAQPDEQKDMVAMRSGQVLICHVDQGCRKEEDGGRTVFVMEADGFTVKASIGFDRDLSHAEISITNGTESPVMVRVADFRMEATDPKLVRLAYVDKEKGPAGKMKAVKEERSHGLPDPSYWGSAKQQKAMQEQMAAKPVMAGLLHSGSVAPGASAVGLAYFEPPKHALAVSLVLPIAGNLFEFPSTPPTGQVKGRKGKKVGVSS